MANLLLSDPRVRGAVLEVDPAAIAANTRLLARAAAGELMAVVKADGFGHGALTVARTALAHGATRIGVTGIEEALPLRDAGITAPVLSWLNPVDADFGAAVEAEVELAVPGREHLDAVVRTTSSGRTARVHLHLDTGMARDGAEPRGWVGLCRAARAAERAGVLRVVGIMGHLGCADEPTNPANAIGRTRFAWGLELARAAGLRPRQRHLAATSATLTDPLSHHTMSRVGAGLVGIDPTGTTPLRGALTLTAPLVGVRTVRAGTPVGYGGTWTAPRTTRLGLLPLGYADGLPRLTSGRAEVLVRGRRHPLVGRISMDMAVVDLGEEWVEAGERVTVLGPGGRGRADRRRLGPLGRHPRARDRHRSRVPHAPHRPCHHDLREPVVSVRIAVVGGGQSCEHDVSLASAAAVASVLDPEAYDVVRLTIGRDGDWRDREDRSIGLAGAVDALRGCAVVLPVLHGPRGEDGTLAALCDLAGVPYVGCGVGAGAVGMDKWATKLVAGAVGIATAPGRLLTAATTTSYAWTHPVVVKPVASGSSLGVSLVGSPDAMASALDAAFALDRRVLVEDLVRGREIDVAVLGRPDGSRTVAPMLEIVTAGLFDFATKYDGGADFRIPAALTDLDRRALEDAAVAMYDALGCAGVVRVDFFLTEDGPVLNEVNTMPGFTEQSQVPKMFAAAGTAYPDLVDLLVRDVLGDPTVVPLPGHAPTDLAGGPAIHRHARDLPSPRPPVGP